ncbi:peripheral-type benzodiazepine receptor-associated protein 1 [Limosa lapponica baueri]|uniref:Peripheral-type benzodiazepine receptor-associated protein 1 n=1 Tax=Limosa lapponica baueri TaxID=1758121 RepID=A0A2I0T1W2_LIMLA|nr:peripheral-type benzodiazepine receptor-associated protein 1 [Limosa lapponica baueri]
MCVLAANGRERFVPELANLPSCKLPAKIFIHQQQRMHGVSLREFVGMEQSVTKASELESPSDSSLKIRMETCHACAVEEPPKDPSTEREKEEKEKHLSPEPLPSPSQAEGTEGTSRDTSAGGSSCQEFLRLSPGQEVMKEMSRVKREVCVTLAECLCPWRDVDCV